jgi:pantoate--beta-alanine ligase
MQQSLLENENTVVSIFVNPTQFNNPEDLAKYPEHLMQMYKNSDLDPKLFVTNC